MYFEDREWQALADRAERGDAAAAMQLRQEMEPHMLRIVRRATEVQNSSPFARRIRRNVDVLASPGPRPAAGDRDQVLRRVARRICHLVTGRSGPPPISNSQSRETVCV
ncbi:MAG TPA: hypothetical protein VKI65_10405 [Gemmataceae bacterium]|nr:hypothetical protein [Gemmataceae bacterium]